MASSVASFGRPVFALNLRANRSRSLGSVTITSAGTLNSAYNCPRHDELDIHGDSLRFGYCEYMSVWWETVRRGGLVSSATNRLRLPRRFPTGRQ